MMKPGVRLVPPPGADLPYTMTKRIRWQIVQDLPEQADVPATRASRSAAIIGWLLLPACSGFLLCGRRSRRTSSLDRPVISSGALAAHRTSTLEVSVLAAMLGAVLATIGALLG